MKAPQAVHDQDGFSLVETILAAGIFSLFVLAYARFQPQLLSFIRHTSTNQTLNQDARRSVDTIRRHLTNAQSSTISISAASPTAPPNSRIDFIGIDQTSYTITWSMSPSNTIHMLRTPPGSSVTNDNIIASNVSSLMFFFKDFRDPSLVSFTVQLQSAYDASNAPASALIANQTVQTVTRQ